MERVGFIGLGIMGKPMAENLLKAGYDLTVFDINSEAVDYIVGLGGAAGSLVEIGENCDIIFTILPNGAVVNDVLFGEYGVCLNINEGKLICDLSSVSAAESRGCFDRLAEKGVGFIDAPVSGGEPGAIAGTLAIMCGGREEDFNRLVPYFEIMGSSSLLIGESGSGSITKLANQVIVNLNIAVLGEALVLATKAGADPMKVFKAIRGGLAGSAVMEAKAPLICKRNFVPGGKISINHKDIKNVLSTAHAIDVPMPLTAQLFEIMQALKVSGHFEDDHGGYVQYFEQLAGVVVLSEEEI